MIAARELLVEFLSAVPSIPAVVSGENALTLCAKTGPKFVSQLGVAVAPEQHQRALHGNPLRVCTALLSRGVTLDSQYQSLQRLAGFCRLAGSFSAVKVSSADAWRAWLATGSGAFAFADPYCKGWRHRGLH